MNSLRACAQLTDIENMYILSKKFENKKKKVTCKNIVWLKNITKISQTLSKTLCDPIRKGGVVNDFLECHCVDFGFSSWGLEGQVKACFHGHDHYEEKYPGPLHITVSCTDPASFSTNKFSFRHETI